MKPSQSQWYAVHTKPRWEKKVAELLSQKKIPHYCPENRVLKKGYNREKWAHEPLFAACIFVYVAPDQQSAVRETAGVLNFLYWLQQPAVIPQEEVDAIRQFLDKHRSVSLEKRRVQPKGEVTVVAGTPAPRKSNFDGRNEKALKMLLPTLGYALVALAQNEHVEVVAHAEAPKESVPVLPLA